MSYQSHCKSESPCNKLTGRCDRGCDNFWSGEFCQSMYTICLIDSFIVGMFLITLFYIKDKQFKIFKVSKKG